MADEEVAAAAVAFDPQSRKYSVLSDTNLIHGVSKGAFLDVDGCQMTVVELCGSVDEAETVCSSRSSDLQNAHLTFQESASDELPLFKVKEEPKDNEDTEYGEPTPEISMDDTPQHPAGGFLPIPIYDEDHNALNKLQDMLENLMDDFADDVVRINMRYSQVKNFLVEYFGTGSDGSIINSFDNHDRRILEPFVKPRSLFRRRPREHYSPSYIDKIVEEARRNEELERERARQRRTEAPTRRSNRAVTTVQPLQVDHKAPGTSSSSRPSGSSKATAYNTRPSTVSGSTASVSSSGPETSKTALRYPFISRAEEEKIYRGCGNIASTYAQRLAKVIFEDTLHLYFKDQEPRRREWIHEAVDYRFPSDDKNTQMLKWKNCSNAINKNMRDTQKAKKEAKAAHKELNYKYVSRELEEDCFERADGDPVKYGEYLAFHCFEETLTKFFKEQDPKRKDWVRECVDRRFPMNDSAKRDARWKIVAAACNRNRFKVVGADGKEEPYPYFPGHIEEECFEESGGVATVYAELMSKHLFPDTQHLMFKDQDIGRRNWLHDILDKRFPTADKTEHVAKWKNCTAAMNKMNMSLIENSTPAATPATPVATTARKDVNKVRRNDDDRSSEEPDAKRPRRAPGTTPKSLVPESKSASDSSTENTPVSGARRKSKTPGFVIKMNGTGNETPLSTPKSAIAISIPKPTTEIVDTSAPVDPFTSYPFISEEEELDVYRNSNGTPWNYARNLARILFEDTLKLYYKDQDPERRAWMREIVEFRFPGGDLKQKWKNICAAINKNMPQNQK